MTFVVVLVLAVFRIFENIPYRCALVLYVVLVLVVGLDSCYDSSMNIVPLIFFLFKLQSYRSHLSFW